MPGNKNDKASHDGFLYGVTLVLNCSAATVSDEVSIEFMNEKDHKITWSKENDNPKLSVSIDSKVDEFNQLLRQVSLSEMLQEHRKTFTDASPCVTLGITLVSHQNVIPAMRKSLSRLFGDVSSMGVSNASRGIAAPLASILESFRSKEVDSSVLSALLNPYLDYGYSNVSKSLLDQKEMFENSAIEALVESIPPIPLALLFITALLEQKIVFTSRRRSHIVSMTVALKKLLEPLDWSHLFVPLVPAELAADLVQYPAPFILGMPFSVGTMTLLKSVPDDVTIVDVDVGRVILAKTFSVHFEAQSNEESKVSTVALRTQVLHLAETLGGVFGSKQSDRLWACDSPHIDSTLAAPEQSKGEAVLNVTSSFLRELLAGKFHVISCLQKQFEFSTPLTHFISYVPF